MVLPFWGSSQGRAPLASALALATGAILSCCAGSSASGGGATTAATQPSASPSATAASPSMAGSVDPSRVAAADGGPPRAGPAEAPPEPASPQSTVEISPPKVTGALAGDSAAIDVVLGAQRTLATCYERALSSAPGAAGTAEFRVHVSPSGMVTRVETPRTGGVPAAATSCMTARLGLLQFNQGRAGAIAFDVRCAPSPP